MKRIFDGPVWLYLLIVNLPTAVFLGFWLESGTPAIPLIVFAVIDAFIYRPLMDYQRLKALGKIEEGDYGEMLKYATIGYRFKYYSTLMFGK